jgi:soluble P-type ATPase
MISIDIPGFGPLEFHHLVLDYNGTLAVDGALVEGVTPALERLSRDVTIHVLTADTFGRAAEILTGLPVRLVLMGPEHQEKAKLDYVRRLGPGKTVCVGNGRNDRLMLKEAVLGMAVLLAEGAASEAVAAADVVCPGIVAALELLLHPLRLTATLRS